MSRLEEKLREALKPEEPPSGFADRVMATAHASSRSGIFMRQGLRWLVAGGLCALIAVGGIGYYHQRAEKAQSEAAKQQLMLALQIAGEQLQLVQSKINRP